MMDVVNNKYPDIYKGLTFGLMDGYTDRIIINNRNEFVEKYNIVKSSSMRIFHDYMYIERVRQSNIMDHVECYIDNSGNYILLSNPYGLNNSDAVYIDFLGYMIISSDGKIQTQDEISKTGYALYSGATSIMKIFYGRPLMRNISLSILNEPKYRYLPDNSNVFTYSDVDIGHQEVMELYPLLHNVSFEDAKTIVKENLVFIADINKFMYRARRGIDGRYLTWKEATPKTIYKKYSKGKVYLNNNTISAKLFIERFIPDIYYISAQRI